MTNNTVFEYDLEEKVWIKALEREATVTGIMRDADGRQYRVVWWNEGERKHEWLYGHELARRV